MRIFPNSIGVSASAVSVKRFAVPSLLLVLFGFLSLADGQTFAQVVRRPGKVQQRIQKKIEKQNGSKLAPDDETAANTTKPPATGVKQDGAISTQSNNLDGIRDRGILSLFSREEAQLVIPGFGRPPALLIVFRQLNLTPEQREKIRAIRLRVGNRLGVLQRDRAQLEQQLEEAIYGENFSMEKVDQLSAQAAEKQGDIIKLQANIEAQFRQILTPDQFYVFQFLIGEMVLPQRRLNPQQQLRRFGNPQNQQNQQNRQTKPPLNQDN